MGTNTEQREQSSPGTDGDDAIWHQGGCHCGRVRYEVLAPRVLEVLDCNCSICLKTGLWHLIVPKTHFRLLQGEDALTEYQFGTGTARHLFCATCGIKSFYIPRSHPDGVDINARCLDQSQVQALRIRPYDGQNWEQARQGIE